MNRGIKVMNIRRFLKSTEVKIADESTPKWDRIGLRKLTFELGLSNAYI